MQKRPDIHKSFSGLTLASHHHQNGKMEARLAKIGAGIVGITLGALLALTIDTAAVEWKQSLPILRGPLELYRLGGVLGGIAVAGFTYNWLAEKINASNPSNPSDS
jgi:hypothetical protein